MVGLREEVAKFNSPTDTKRARRRLPEVLRTARGFVRSLKNGETGRLAFLRADVDTLSDDERAELKESLETAQNLLERLVRMVEG